MLNLVASHTDIETLVRILIQRDLKQDLGSYFWGASETMSPRVERLSTRLLFWARLAKTKATATSP